MITKNNSLQPNQLKPLCVDCDGTLIQGDLLRFDLEKLFSRMPWMLPTAAGWLAMGRNQLKVRLANLFPLDAASLAFRLEVLELIRARRQQKGKVFLATASAQAHAERISLHLGIFDGIFASDESRNLKSAKKAEVLTQSFGPKGFDYLGDSRVDIPVWRVCDQAMVWSDKPDFLSHIRKINPSAVPVIPLRSS